MINQHWENIRGTLLRQLPLSFALLTLFTSAVSLLWYIFEGYKLQFHSDSATKVLLAKEMLITGQIFPETWFYANGDLWAFSSHLFVLPFLLFLPAGYLAHAFGAVLNATFLLVTVFVFLKAINPNLNARLYVTALVASGMSAFGAENLFGQYSYSIAFIFLMIYLSSSVTVATSKPGARNWPSIILIASIVFSLSLSAPSRSIVYLLLPMAMAMASIIRFTNHSDKIGKKNVISLVLVNGGAFAVGTSLRLWLGTGLQISSVASVGVVVEPMQWPANLVNSALNVLLLLGAEGSGTASLFSIAGVTIVFKYVLVGILVGMLGSRINKDARLTTSSGQAMLVYFTVVGIGLTLVIATLTNLGEPRYWQISVALALVVGLARIFLNSQTNGSHKYVSLLVVALVIVNIFTVTAKPIALSDKPVVAPTTNLIAFLEKNSLTHGYASYWNADNNTILSDSKVLIRQVFLAPSGVLPMKWLASSEWYSGRASKSSFLLLSAEEALALPKERLVTLGVTPVASFEFEGWIIHKFDVDIANSLAGWKASFEKPQRWLADEYSASQLGKLEELPSTNGLPEKCLVAPPGEAGYVYFGPYVEIDRGSYYAAFDIRASESLSALGLSFDVAVGQDARILARQKATGFHEQIVEFEISEKSDNLQLRFFTEGAVGSAFCGVTLSKRETD